MGGGPLIRFHSLLLGCAICSVACADCSKPAPPQTETTSAHEQEADAGGAGSTTPPAGGAESTAPPAEPPKAHSTVTFNVKNKSGADWFYFYTRHPSSVLLIERREGDEWVALASEVPTCSEPCPADGSKPTCRSCSPAAPRPRCGLARKLELTWWGLAYETVRGTQDWCYCHQASAAPPGKYRATLTLHPEASCEQEPCEFDQNGIAAGTVSGEPTPLRVEFDLTDADQTVTFTLE
jgi:hypothetical protein